MNPMNSPSQGPGPMLGQRPQGGGPPNMYNGPPQGQGMFPGKQGMPPSQFSAPNMQNGSFPGPQGENFRQQSPFGAPNNFGGQQPPMNRGPPPQNNLTSQMGAMNLDGHVRGPGQMSGPTPGMSPGMRPPGPPRPGMPSSPSRFQQGLQNPGMRPGFQPPNSMYGPPSSASGPPQPMTGPPAPIQGPPVSMQGLSSSMHAPTNSMQGPSNSMQGPPNSMQGPPNSMHGPPNSMHGPPNSMHGPPNSMYRPPNAMSGPPNSMSGPPTSMQGPPSSSFGMHSTSFSPGPAPVRGPPPSVGPPTSLYNPAPPSGGPNFPNTSIPGQNRPMPPMGQYPGPPQNGMPPQVGMNSPPQTMPPQQNFQPSIPQQVGNAQPGFPPPPPQGGMPPSPAHSPPGQYGQYPQTHRPVAAPSQPRRLDPDQMPSPIQVIEDDNRSRGGVFQTGIRGAVPPLVTTDFISEDLGNSNPRFIRSTMYNIPCTQDIVKQCQIPIALTINPFAKLDERENPPPLVNLGEMGPVRCNRCKAYMNPHMTFIDGGRRFQCCFCLCSTEVPAEYFAHLDHTGNRVDKYERPELFLGSYEFVATKEYCRNNQFPKPPAFIFMIDVSYHAVKCGLVHLLCDRLKNDILINLPREAGMEESEIRVGFATYSNVIHFYNVKGCLAQPQMLVVSDVQDMFVPLVDGFLVKLSESEAVIDSLLEQIPFMFHESRETETILGPVIQAGLDALKSADCSGKLYIFHTSLPIAEAPGKLKNRDDRKLLGTDKEKTILSPSNNFYTKLGQDCVTAGCSVDLFLFPNAYIDIATIGELCRYTGGQMYKYTYFQADIDGERFVSDLIQNISRPIAFDAIMRIRTSTGIRPTDFLGNFYMSNTTDVELAAVDCDKAITLEIKHDDKLNEADGAYIQAAVLYTSITGQRRLRVHNLALNCCSMMADVFRNVELDAVINHMAKLAIRGILTQPPKTVRETIMTQCAQILGCYRKNCASPSSAGQLILPECMKLLPLYTNCIIKSDALQATADISTDDRSYLMHLVNSMDVSASAVFFYPRLIPLHTLDLDTNELPNAVRCSMERLQEDGAYLLENGISMFLWIGHNISPEWVNGVFGVQSSAQIDIDKTILLELDSPLSQRVRKIVNKIRAERNRYMKLTIVRQRDKLEPWFHHFLVEDRGSSGTASYVEYLCHIHKEIRNLLS